VELLLPDGLSEVPAAHAATGPAEVRGRRKDGTEFSAEVALGDVGADRGLVAAAIRDAGSRAPDDPPQVVRAIVHDLNNALAVILQSAELLQGQLEEESRARRDADRILRAVEQAVLLTQQLPRSTARDRQTLGAPSEAPGVGRSEAGAGKETLLLVEDEEDIREMATRMLEAAGYTVLATGSCAEALDICERFAEELDLVLTDIRMPDMPGTELADRILAAHPDLPVLFMSGSSDRTLRGATGSKTAGFVEKPFTSAALLGQVRAALDS
jgi:CheY-like chemotaxis protein